MRSYCSVYVDAGYLLASAATRATGTSLRNGIHVEFGRLVASLISQAQERSGLPVLRLHWYDSAKDGVPDRQQERIGELPQVKLRLGRFGVDGQQKGVDLRIGLDLVAHARNQAADVFFLVSGDDDLTEAVEEAQAHGVQVVVLAVPRKDGSAHGLSRHLIRAADEVILVSATALDATVIAIEPKTVDEPALGVDTSAADEMPQTAAAPITAPITASIPLPGPRPRPGTARPAAADLVGRPRAVAEPAPVVVYSGFTGKQPEISPAYEDPESYAAEIDRVIGRVIEAFRRAASPQEISTLQLHRPLIPKEVDGALLVDLCGELQLYDLSEHVRFALRKRFWELYDTTP